MGTFEAGGVKDMYTREFATGGTGEAEDIVGVSTFLAMAGTFASFLSEHKDVLLDQLTMALANWSLAPVLDAPKSLANLHW